MNRKELLETILKSKELTHLTKKDADKLLTTTFEMAYGIKPDLRQPFSVFSTVFFSKKLIMDKY